MNVTPQNRYLEREVLRVTQETYFKDEEFEQSADDDVFDFYSKTSAIAVDVKAKNSTVNQYLEYFISTQKVDRARAGDLVGFVIFYFRGDGYVRCYNLTTCPVEKTTAKYTHKRTGEEREDEVYAIPAPTYEWEFRVQEVKE